MILFLQSYFKYVPVAILLGSIIDLFLGDPMWLVHPVQIIGKLISLLESKLLPQDHAGHSRPFLKGMLLWIVVVLATAISSLAVLFISFAISPYLLLAVMVIMSWQCIAARSLVVAAMKVYKALSLEDIDLARKEVSMIVGRDTEALDEKGIARAAVETVAENTNDGVICPLFFLMLGGPVLAFVYKAVSTMDSMIGYKNDKYIYFGRFAAKADDVFAFIPARLSAVLMILATGVMQIIHGALSFFKIAGDSRPESENVYSMKDAAKIFIRDRFNHASPNSAQCESVCAGALGLRLAGPTSYFGKIHDKPYIGDAKREIDKEDIRRSCVLMYGTVILMMALYAFLYFLIK